VEEALGVDEAVLEGVDDAVLVVGVGSAEPGEESRGATGAGGVDLAHAATVRKRRMARRGMPRASSASLTLSNGHA